METVYKWLHEENTLLLGLSSLTNWFYYFINSLITHFFPQFVMMPNLHPINFYLIFHNLPQTPHVFLMYISIVMYYNIIFSHNIYLSPDNYVYQ